MPEAPMSALYRSMIYAAVATMYFYRDDVAEVSTSGSTQGAIDVFRDKNRKIVERVFEEIGNLFDYELSWHQMDTAIVAYLMTARSIEKPAATHQSNAA